MFPKELLDEGPVSVYLFLMKPAVALMADIFNRSPSHTEENNKQQATSFCQSSHTQSTAKGSFLFMPLQLYDVWAHCNPALQLIQNLLRISSKVHLFPT